MGRPSIFVTGWMSSRSKPGGYGMWEGKGGGVEEKCIKGWPLQTLKDRWIQSHCIRLRSGGMLHGPS